MVEATIRIVHLPDDNGIGDSVRPLTQSTDALSVSSRRI